MRSSWWGGDHPVTQPWGCTDLAVEPFDPRFPDCAHYHQGVDIGRSDPADPHWLVVAGKPNLVVVSSYIVWSPAAESLLKLTDGANDYWLFHGARHLVSVGAQLTLGQALMNVGDIGIAAGAHLHFEVRPAGSSYRPYDSIDPIPFLQEEDDVQPLSPARKRFHAFQMIMLCWGRNPSSEQELNDVANVIQDDGENLYDVQVAVYNNPNGEAYRAKQGAGSGQVPAHQHSGTVTVN